MSTATIPQASTEYRVLLHNIRWQTYEMLLADIGDRRVYLTYDRGELEIMAPSYRHERLGRLLGRCIVILAEELDMPFIGCGSTTFRREDLERGLEPDECFYFQNVHRIVGKTDLDLAIDPPPDLAIEVDITSSSVDRMSIYAALGVPEIWRFEEDTLQVHRLRPDRVYEIRPSSPTFPGLPLQELVSFLRQTTATDELTLLRSFRSWVKKEVLPMWKGTGDGQ